MTFITRSLAAACLFSALPVVAVASSTATINDPIQKLVTGQQKDHGLVGLGVMVMQNGEVVASAVSGERKYGSGVPVSVNDKWHLGSITKSFTATMIARLVERGEFAWSTTISDVLADDMKISNGWRNVTLAHLLTHTSGASSRLARPFSYNFRDHPEGVTRLAARRELIADFMADDPLAAPGTRFMYSNAGIVIASVMAEEITGLSWEDLIRREIFAPLGMRSAGFGHPSDGEESLQQPRGHKSLLGFTVSADDDPTVVIGPAGSIHVSLADLMLYASDHLQGENGGGKLLKPETYRRLHTPVLDNYAYGWVVIDKEPWANGKVLWHNGSNGAWDALLAMAPESNTIIAVTTNDGRQASSDVTWTVLKKAAELMNKPKDTTVSR